MFLNLLVRADAETSAGLPAGPSRRHGFALLWLPDIRSRTLAPNGSKEGHGGEPG
jgi:hypothetical protein